MGVMGVSEASTAGASAASIDVWGRVVGASRAVARTQDTIPPAAPPDGDAPRAQAPFPPSITT